MFMSNPTGGERRNWVRELFLGQSFYLTDKEMQNEIDICNDARIDALKFAMSPPHWLVRLSFEEQLTDFDRRMLHQMFIQV